MLLTDDELNGFEKITEKIFALQNTLSSTSAFGF